MSRRRKLSDRCVVQGGPLHGRIISLGVKRRSVTIREREADGGLRPYTFERIERITERMIGLIPLRQVTVGEVTEYRRPPDVARHMRIFAGIFHYDNDPRHYRHGL